MVLGWRDGGVDRATGIRYATAERYHPPVTVDPTDAVIDATYWSPACPQPVADLLEELLPDPLGGLTFDEDCLRLSLTIPAGTSPGARLPVLVWIHGGAYTWGAGDAPVFDPAYFVAEQRVIVVSVTYRLGLLGYLGVDGRPANLGLLDQIEALRWVRANVAAFGGDPDNVTLMGQSAGGDAVAHLMIARGTDELFRRAIIASAPLGILSRRDRMYARMADVAARVAVDSPIAELLDHQRRVHASVKRFGLKSAMAFGVRYGHDPLPVEGEAENAWRRAARRTDVLIGWTSREAALHTVSALARLTRIRLVGPAAQETAVNLITRRVYSDPGRVFARRHHRAGGRGARYLISWGAPTNPYRGAHLIDMPLLFWTERGYAGSALLDGADPDDVRRAGAPVRQSFGDFIRSGALHRVDVPHVFRLDALG